MRRSAGARARGCLVPCLAISLASWALLASGPALAAPARDVHSLDWFVHQCLVDADGLPFYADLLGARLLEADRLIEGLQGPADTGCCVSLDPATVSAFGSCGDGIDVIENQTELDVVLGGGATAGAYLVEGVHFCASTFSTSIRGCANTPGDHFVVGREADDKRFLPTVVAHERGHNAGLGHVSSNPCELMAGSSGGGCLSTSECSSFVAKADTSSGSCACLDDVLGDPPVADGTSCIDEGACQACSGGLCAACDEGALSRSLVAGGAGAPSGEATDDALDQSFAAGHWSDVGVIDMGVEVTGMAYDPGRDVVFAVESLAGDDDLVTLDPATGAKTGTVGTIDFSATIDDDVIALAYDPGADLLYAIHVDDEVFGSPFDCVGADPCISSLLEIDPDDASSTELGELNTLIIGGGVQGLAYDDLRGDLYGAAASGLAVIDVASCNGTTCDETSVDGEFRRPVALGYDPTADRLVRQGAELGRTETDRIDPASGAIETVRGLDPFTPGGMAVVHVPEPARELLWLAGVGFLAGAARIRGAARAARRRGDPAMEPRHRRDRSLRGAIGALICALCGVLASGAASPVRADPAADEVAAEALVRAQYFEGLPFDAAAAVTPAGAARLVEMLADPAEAEQHAAILEVLGICAAPGAYEAIAAFAASEPAGAVDGPTWRARLAIPIALGHLARRDPRALRELIRRSRLGEPPGWHYRYMGAASVGVTLHRRAITGLALSAQPDAEAALRALAPRPAVARDLRGEMADVGAHLDEALALHARLAAEGAEAVLGGGAGR